MDAMAPEHACKISRIKIAHWPIIKWKKMKTEIGNLNND